MPGRTNAVLAAGHATYVDDVQPAGCLTLAVLRSPHAAARIARIDVTAARAVPGVRLVVTGEDVAAAGLVIHPSGVFDFFDVRQSDRYPLAVGRVRHAGEPVVAVVADDGHAARAACRAVVVSYDVGTPLLTVDDALAPGAPVVEEGWPDNLMVDWTFGTGDVEAALDGAPGRAEGRLVCGRIAATPLEPRGIVAEWDRWTESLTVWASTQGPHVLRTQLAGVLGLDDAQVRVVQPQVGGAFGAKIPMFPEDVLTTWAAIALGTPVRWIEERHEYLAAGGHSRDIACRYRVAFDPDGRLAALDVVLDANLGAPSTIAGFLMSIVTAGTIPGSYLVPALRVQLRGVVTNLGPWQAYRGYGKEASTFFLERILDDVARRTGVDRADVRRRNFVRPEQFPHQLPSGWIMDSGDYAGTLDLALELIGAEGFAERRRQAAAEGRLIGLGFAHELTPEGSARPGSLLGGTDSSTVRMSPRGHVTVLTGVTSPGGGNETGLAQLVADELGVDIDTVRVVQGDTQSCPHGNGNYSSRSLTIGGASARLAAADVRGKLEAVAARMLAVPAPTLRFSRGVVSSSATARTLAVGAVAGEVYRNPHGAAMDDVTPGLESTRSYKMPNVHHQFDRTGIYNQYPTWSFGAAACVVEVDAVTGQVTVLEMALAHDCGVVVNPTLAEAQLHGAVMQGIGAALYEEIAYDEHGSLESVSLREYTLPSAREWVPVRLGHRSTPSPYTHRGMKGVGESGISAPAPAIAAAVEDALAHRVVLAQVPLTPARVWAALQQEDRT
jgi:carbon-monoxide dehydrogenase large subunit